LGLGLAICKNSAKPNERWQAGLMRLDGVRVLLVDDEQDTRNLLTVILGQSGAMERRLPELRKRLNHCDSRDTTC
jgi:hypothetical protein